MVKNGIMVHGLLLAMVVYLSNHCAQHTISVIITLARLSVLAAGLPHKIAS